MNTKMKAATRDGAIAASDRAYHHGNLRAAAITAALEALAHKMPSEISLRDLAKTVGVRHSALYVHFRDRDELFAIVSGEGFETLRAQLAKAVENADDDKIAALSAAYLRFARAHPAHYRVMYSPANMSAGNSDHVLEACNACLTMLVQAVADKARTSMEEAERRAIGIWCALHGLVQLGGETGVLRQRVTLEEEGTLAVEFTQALARSA